MGNKLIRVVCIPAELRPYQQHGDMAPVTGVLEWGDTGSSGGTGRGHEEGGAALYVSDQMEGMELHLGMDEELTKKL